MDDSNKVPVTDALRCLPAVHELLAHPRLVGLAADLGLNSLTRLARQAIGGTRQAVLEKTLPAEISTNRLELLEHCADCVLRDVASQESSALQPVINGTGVLLHTNLGRAPLAEAATEAINRAAGYVNVELNVGSGRRAPRGQETLRMLAELTGAESALVVNNCAAATVLALSAISADRETVISRSQLVEIGGGFRLPEVFQSAGAILREVGTTNRTYVRDFESALNERTAAVMRVHRSNFEISGFCSEPTLAELVDLTSARGLTMIDDVGSGCLYDFKDLPDEAGRSVAEPNVLSSVRTGADLVLFSGDKLFGGPQAGIIVGKVNAVAKLARHPLMRALRPDKLTLAGLEATTQLHLSGEHRQSIPLYRQLYREKCEIESACRRVVSALGSAGTMNAAVVETMASVGGGTLPGFVLPSFAVSLTSKQMTESQLAERLRQCKPAILCRVESQAVLVDLRCVGKQQEESLTREILKVAREAEDKGHA
ncbi:MAG TPA: L-seryl-tRNA(Sec) selenium transferase [Planctomycetaceae bacterium]|nr:L-seryl-tRNA(Sec) selenium transferase [Planctomycetaceae bacterium]